MRAKICKTAKQCRICQTRRLRDYAEHIAQKHLWKSFATKSATCKVTVRPQMPFSANQCGLSSGFSEEEAAASYALNRIKSYQVQMMSPVLLIHVSLTFIHASPRTNPVVYAEHIAQETQWKRFATKSTTCKVTVRPQNMPFSVNHCSLSSGLSEEEAAASYALNRIKSYQVQMMSLVLLIHVSLTFIHASPRTNPVVYAEHIAQETLWKSFATKSTTCKVTVRPQNIPFSVNHCSLSSGFSEEEAAASYALNRIKSYQVQMMSPVLLIHVSLTFIHASPRTNPVVRLRAKKCKTASQCQTCQARRLRDYAEHNAQKHR